MKVMKTIRKMPCLLLNLVEGVVVEEEHQHKQLVGEAEGVVGGPLRNLQIWKKLTKMTTKMLCLLLNLVEGVVVEEELQHKHLVEGAEGVVGVDS
jgi:hypothetical protein